MTDSLQELQQLIERRNAVATKRDALLAEADRLGSEVDSFDKQIRFADAARVADGL